MLSLFCVITLILVMVGEAAEADSVAILRDHAHFGDDRDVAKLLRPQTR